MSFTAERARRALEKVAKWRSLFAGWQLGTRPDTDPECRAIRDHREISILLRVEVSAMLDILLKKGVITMQDWYDAIGNEAEQLDQDYASRFPGVTSSEDGLIFSSEKLEEIRGWMFNWKP